MASNCNVLQPYCIIPKCRQLQDKAAPCPSLDICIYSDAASLLSLLRCIRKISTLCSNKMFGGVCFSFPPLVLKISEGTRDVLLFLVSLRKTSNSRTRVRLLLPLGLYIYIYISTLQSTAFLANINPSYLSVRLNNIRSNYVSPFLC